MSEELKVDQVMPAGKWEFDASVTEAFDNMLQRSIPQYEVMRRAVLDVGTKFVKAGSHVFDLGCSRGEALAPFVDRFGCRVRFVAAEISEPMLAAAKARFKGMIDCGVVDVQRCDLREKLPHGAPSLVLLILTLQFTPIEHRQRILRDICRALIPGGALVLVEKVLGADADIDGLMVGVYHAMKAENGYTREQIERKRLSLEGVLVPVTAAWNEDLLRQAGFASVDCFWRWMNFAAWVAVKAGEVG